MVWPDWYGETIVEFVVVENLASLVHVAAAALFAYLGCARRVFPAYALYQLATTAGKTLALPGHTLADWSWDFAGDTMEFAIGVGAVYLAGLEGRGSRLAGGGLLGAACSWRGVAAGTALLFAVWLAALAGAVGPG